MSDDGLTWIEKLPALPPRPDDGHKGTFGTVVVVGGSPLMFGATALTATAALRSGAGLVKVAGDPAWLPNVIAIQPSVTGIDRSQFHKAGDDGQTVLAIGPGLGTSKQSRSLVDHAIDWFNPMVWDADGLNLMAQIGRTDGRTDPHADSSPWVLTPHPGEFRRLAEAFDIHGDPTDPDQRPAAAGALARATGAVVLLKGQHTIVTDGRRAYRNLSGNPALATAGTGDVLTGLIAGLIAQGAEAFEASCLAAYLHGDAADDWAETHGQRGLLAMDLAHALPAAIHRFANRAPMSGADGLEAG